MRTSSKLALGAFGLLLILFGFLFIYANVKIIGYTEYDVDYFVGSHIGINLDEDAIHFGTLQPGNAHRRELIVRSERDVLVRVIPYGLDYLVVENDNTLVFSGEEAKISLLLRLPLSAEEGFHSGKLKVIYLRP